MNPEELVQSVRDDPEGRYQLRVAFYEKYGFARDRGAGYGTSELAFLRWEIERGVLNPVAAAQPGSPWWRNVNEEFLYCSELAAAIAEGTGATPADEVAAPVRFWLDYIHQPSRQSWYRAHNRSIVAGYLKYAHEAEAENTAEQRFLNMVLYRLLYAQALEEGDAPGLLARIMRALTRHAALVAELECLVADPRAPSVDLLVHLPEFYPRHYPLSEQDIAYIFDRCHGIRQDAEQVMDRVLISPYLTRLYRLASGWLHTRALAALVSDDKPCYPAEA